MKKYISPEIMVVAMDEEIMQGLNNTTGDGNQLGNNTLFDDMGNVLDAKKYTGTTQVQVNDGETTEKTILMVETN